MSDQQAINERVDAWLVALESADGPCGADLEYDNDFLALTQAAAGKPETQFESAVAPDWRAVSQQADDLFDRTRDLRVAMLWLRAQLNLHGLLALPPGLRLLQGLLDGFWDTLHPVPDDGDAYARINTLNELRDNSTALSDIRQALLFNARGFGPVSARTAELALGVAQPRDGEAAPSRDALLQMLRAAIDADAGLALLPDAAIEALRAIERSMQERVGHGEAPDLQPPIVLLRQLMGLMREAASQLGIETGAADRDISEDGAIDPQSGRSSATQRGAAGLSGSVNSREDALRAIDLVCEYLERTEPTNPAQLLLRRARRLVNQNFLQLMKELAPDALSEVARIMGVDPDSVSLDDT